MTDLYRPSLVINVTLRFDEALLVSPTPQADEFGALDPNTVKGPSVDFQIGTREINLGPLGTVRIPKPTARIVTGGIEPLILKRGEDNLSHILNIVPESGSVEASATRQAGKFNFSLDYSALPIDPVVIRAAAVEIHLGTINEKDFSDGMNGAVLGVGNRRTSQLRTRVGGQPNPETLVFVGTIDKWKTNHDEKGSKVEIEGRDLRGIFLDGKIPPLLLSKLDLRDDIVGVVQQILNFVPFGAGVTVAADSAEWPNGKIPSPGTSDGSTRVQTGAKGKGGAAGGSSSDRPNAWDIITQYCFLVGAIPYFEGWILRVRPAHSFFDLRQAGLDAEATGRRFITGSGPSLPTPFADGLPRNVGGEKIRWRRLVYGRDISKLSFEKKLGGVKVPTVEVIGIDDTKRGKEKLIIVHWPPKSHTKARQTSVSPGGEVAQTDTMRVPVHGIRDAARLLVIAREIYEEVGHGEIGGHAETSSLSSYGGSSEDPDMVRLRVGDAVEFVVDARALSSQSPLVSELNDHHRRSFEEEVDAIKLALGDENLARVIVAASRSAIVDQLRTYKVASARWDLANSGALRVSFDFQNYIISRHEVPTKEARPFNAKPRTTKSAARLQEKVVQPKPTPVAAPAVNPTSAVQSEVARNLQAASTPQVPQAAVFVNGQLRFVPVSEVGRLTRPRTVEWQDGQVRFVNPPPGERK